MKDKTTESLNRTSQSHPHASEIVRETDTQTLTKLLLAELHSALCWQKQTLAEAAAEIQQLLQQLEKNNPTATAVEKQAFVTAAIAPTRREQFLSALQAGWKEMLKEFLEQPYLKVGIATLRAWKEAD